MGHPMVLQAAAIGEPDPDRGEAIHAFVVLCQTAVWDGLEAELIARVRELISPHVAPRVITAIDEMPLTATGKIMRRALKGR